MSSLADQLAPMLEEWAAEVAERAAGGMEQVARDNAPDDTGETARSIEARRTGQTSYEMTADDRGFTDEGPEPHRIEGNPLLAFDWPGAGLFPAVFAHVDWVPGAGVAANRGWWTLRSATDDEWLGQLEAAADAVTLR